MPLENTAAITAGRRDMAGFAPSYETLSTAAFVTIHSQASSRQKIPGPLIGFSLPFVIDGKSACHPIRTFHE